MPKTNRPLSLGPKIPIQLLSLFPEGPQEGRTSGRRELAVEDQDVARLEFRDLAVARNSRRHFGSEAVREELVHEAFLVPQPEVFRAGDVAAFELVAVPRVYHPERCHL